MKIAVASWLLLFSCGRGVHTGVHRGVHTPLTWGGGGGGSWHRSKLMHGGGREGGSSVNKKWNKANT